MSIKQRFDEYQLDIIYDSMHSPARRFLN